jgi:hypothetical protein
VSWLHWPQLMGLGRLDFVYIRNQAFACCVLGLVVMCGLAKAQSVPTDHFELPSDFATSPESSSLHRPEPLPDKAGVAKSSSCADNTKSPHDPADDPKVDPTDLHGSPGPAQPSSFRGECSDGSFHETAENSERVQWKPILKESLYFLVFEHGFRTASDSSIPYMLFHKPFWGDWATSLQNFDMKRWGDGDDFLVNYVGHPMEGAVSGDIFTQNDPRYRAVRFGKSGAYWKGKLRAMGWAALYSAYFETGPVLSEAAIGNEGGYTYVPDCGLAPCSKPGRHFKPPTNNTGWVDFVVTPLIGTGWSVMEDAIETEIVDRLADDSPSLTWKIVRGSLSPSRTLANLMQWKEPWYRPWISGDASIPKPNKRARALKPAATEAAGLWIAEPRNAVGFHYVNLNIPMDWNGCHKCRVENSGFGANYSFRLYRRVWFDSEVNHFPSSGTHAGHGSATEGLFGIRYGYTRQRWSLYAKVRPGFVYYPKTTSYPTGNEYVTLSRFALDLGAVAERKISRRSVVRIDVGATFIRYLQGLDPRQPPVAVISPNYIATQGNLQVSTGYVYRF